ncbi:MAG TPA: DUF5706 domain-containing protein, partial [Ignavibacteria bacterium]|nr:DUF5706 domain-containing protein [Ignavibacteria bacterium]
MSNNKSITEEAADFVNELFKNKLQTIYVYHNITHTEEVVEAAKKIGNKLNLNDEDLEIVTLAAWFHDTGFIERVNNHEDVSIDIAVKFLTEKNYKQENIEMIKGCINATRYPQSPTNILEEILCDADLYHLGNKNFDFKNDLLRIEWEKSEGKIYSDIEWIKINLDFLTTHKFYTKPARKSLTENKIDMLVKLQKKHRKKIAESEENVKSDLKIDIEKQKIESKKESSSKADRGIETMFRNVIRTHVEFSAMADNKANIMISVNTLIIGGLITFLLRKLDTNPQLIIPTFSLLLVSLTCIVFGVLVTTPKNTAGVFSKDDIVNKKTNLLFFGNFFK